MKQTLIILFFLIMTSSFSQTLEKKIANIREKYNVITNAVNNNSYKKQSIEFACPSNPSYGHLAFYSEGSVLRMIEIDNSDGSHSGEKQQYYIWDGKLIFYYSTGGSWTFDGQRDTTVVNNDTIYKPHTRDDLYEERCYFYNGKPIKCLIKTWQTNNYQENNQTSETTQNSEIKCDTQKVEKLYSRLLKLNTFILKGNDCPKEILDLLADNP